MMNTIVLQRTFLLCTLSVALCTSLSAAATLTPEEQLTAVLSNMTNYISSQEALDTQASCSSTDQNVPIQSILTMHAKISKQCQELEAACINIGCTHDTQGNLQAPAGILQERAEVALQMLQASRTFCEKLSQNLLSVACLISLPDEVSDKITLTPETQQALQTFVENNRSTEPLPDIFSTQTPQPTTLYAAVKKNDLTEVQQILATDKSSINTHYAIDPSALDITETPLHAAAKAGNAQIITALLDAGANIEAKNISGKTPLAIAVLETQPEAVEVLLQHNAQTNVPCWGEVDVVTTIANLYEIEDQAQSPSCIKIAELLIKHGASISPALQKSLCFTEAQKNIAASNSSMQQPSQGNSSTHSATASTPSTPSNTAPQATSTQPNRGPQPSTSSSSGPANPSGQADTNTQPTPAKSSTGYLTAGGVSTVAGLAGLWWVYTQEYLAAEKIILAQRSNLTPEQRTKATKELVWKNINAKPWAEKKALAASLAALTAGLGLGVAAACA